MNKNSQLSLLDIVERQEILDKADSEDFEEAMDKIKNLPHDDWWQLFSKGKKLKQLRRTK